jgi:zinc protease
LNRIFLATRLGLFLLAALLGLPAAEAAAVSLPRVSIRQFTLANGLRVLMVERRDAPVVSVQVWYHVGSKNDPPGKSGLAHLFEHLMFQGTRNIGPEMFSDYIVRAGGEDNAYTTEDYTVYWETFPSNLLPVVLWLEADRMRNLEISERILETEKEVVKEERRTRFENPPYGTVIEKLYRLAFTVHPYHHPAVGSLADLESITTADVKSFYDAYYTPNNATLVMVGDFDAEEALGLVNQYFGPIPSGKAFERNIPREPPQGERRSLRLVKNVALPAFVTAYHMPADGAPDAYPLRLASKILSEGESSRIYRRLVYDQGIALEAESAGNFSEDPNLFFVFAVLNSGHTPADGEAALTAEIERVKSELVSEEELDKAKNQILRDFVLSRQTTRSLGEELGYAAVVLKDPELLNTELDRFLSVTREDIRRVARTYFVPENSTVVEIVPAAQEALREAVPAGR